MRPDSHSELVRMRAPQRSLVLAFLLVTASFVVSTAYSQLWVGSIHRSATDIATSAGPSIEKLASARAALSALALDLRAMAQERLAVDDRAVREQERALDAEIQAYLALTSPSREKEVETRLTSTAEVLGRAADRMTAALNEGDFVRARQVDDELMAAVMQLSAAILAAMKEASDDAIALAQGIASTRVSSLRIAFALDLVCVLTAAFAAVIVSRVLRVYGAVVESRNQLLARRADELDAFASRVAHDIVNPLGTIKLGLELVSKRVTDPTAKPIIARTLASVDRAALIVRDLLTFARASSAPSKDVSVDLRLAASNVVEELSDEARGAGIHLSMVDMPACFVSCAPGILASILSNLVRNSIKYMGEGPAREITIRGRQRDGSVEVEVADTGPGVDADKLAVIWLPYVRGSGVANRPGMGLGLATVKRLVEAHEGTVSVRSEPGRGSVFTFELPTRL